MRSTHVRTRLTPPRIEGAFNPVILERNVSRTLSINLERRLAAARCQISTSYKKARFEEHAVRFCGSILEATQGSATNGNTIAVLNGVTEAVLAMKGVFGN